MAHQHKTTMPHGAEASSKLTYGSVCSGIEAASTAWESLGWRAAWFAEIEKFPAHVLKQLWPDVPNLGDMTKIAARVIAGSVPAPDVLVGGTPCQAFSIAGLRGGLSDQRGQLTLSFVQLANAIDTARSFHGKPPCVITWENVPGVLSSKDNAFGCFLGALAGEDCPLEPAGKRWSNAGYVLGPKRAVAWRVLDAQYFGVAQRRRRVFVVASARDDFDPREVLFESEGVRRDSAPRREAGEDVAGGTLRSTDGGSDVDHARAGHLLPVAFGGNNTSGSIDVATARNACASASASGRMDFESETFVVHAEPIAFNSRQDPVSSTEVFGAVDSCPSGSQAVAYAIQAGATRVNPSSGPDGMGVQADIAYTLEARAEVQAVFAFDPNQITSPTNRSKPTSDLCHTLPAKTEPPICFSAKDYGADATVDLSPTLRAGGHSDSHANAGVMPAVYARLMRMRRLMPVEGERLQGFPDGHTAITVRGKPAADGPRYRAIGNSMAVPCMAWLGRRIDKELRK